MLFAGLPFEINTPIDKVFFNYKSLAREQNLFTNIGGCV
jgi:hypothetical protein